MLRMLFRVVERLVANKGRQQTGKWREIAVRSPGLWRRNRLREATEIKEDLYPNTRTKAGRL